jgi:predicted aspartyl protease
MRIPTFYEFGNYNNDRVDFIFDTGAFISVISRKEALIRGFDNSFATHTNVRLAGFSGSCHADILEIPGFVIGGRRLEGVKVAIPYADTDVNILGLNVIELFKYYIDTEKDEIYFAQNPTPSIPKQLYCNKIHLISAKLNSKLGFYSN